MEAEWRVRSLFKADASKVADEIGYDKVRPRVCRDFICDPKQRPTVDISFVSKCRHVLVRKEFFGNG